MTDDYLAGTYKNQVRITPMMFIFPWSMMQYMLTAQVLDIIQVCPLCVCSPYVTTCSWVIASNFAFTLPYNCLHWPWIGILCALVKQKLQKFHETCLRKMVWFHHVYSTFCSFLCTATWRGSVSLLLPKFLNVLKKVRTLKVKAGCKGNVEKITIWSGQLQIIYRSRCM